MAKSIKKLKIATVGGGTAGHITPLVAVMREVKKLHRGQVEIHLFHQKEDDVFSDLLDGVNPVLHRVTAGKIRRFAHWKWWEYLTHIHFVILNVRDVFRLFIGYIQSLSALRRIRPDILFSKGGFVALPVGLAAASLKIPIITHDSDARAGLSNKIINHWAKKQALGMPVSSASKVSNQIYTGTPVRAEFYQSKKATSRKKLKIAVNEKVIVITGGSLGAKRINNAVLDILEKVSSRGYRIYHFGGGEDYERLRRSIDTMQIKNDSKYKLLPFVGNELIDIYSAADVVVSRTGATSIAELAVLKKAVIFIPNSYLGDQIANAELIAKKQAAYILSEKILLKDSDTLFEAIEFLVNDRRRMKKYAHNLHKFAKSKSATQIAKLLTKIASDEKKKIR